MVLLPEGFKELVVYACLRCHCLLSLRVNTLDLYSEVLAWMLLHICGISAHGNLLRITGRWWMNYKESMSFGDDLLSNNFDDEPFYELLVGHPSPVKTWWMCLHLHHTPCSRCSKLHLCCHAASCAETLGKCLWLWDLLLLSLTPRLHRLFTPCVCFMWRTDK